MTNVEVAQETNRMTIEEILTAKEGENFEFKMVFVQGRTRSARWFLGQRPSELTSGLTSGLTSIDNG